MLQAARVVGGGLDWFVPAGVPATTRGLILRGLAERDEQRRVELDDLATQHAGGASALGDRYFPLPDGQNQIDWEDLKQRLLVHVNLTKTAARSLRAAVYGGTCRRAVLRNPYKEEITALLGRRWSARMRGWFENKAVFGTAAAVPVLDWKGRVRIWQPNPTRLRLYTDPMLADEYVALVEMSLDERTARFVTADAIGWLVKGAVPEVVKRGDAPVTDGRNGIVQIADFGFFPAKIGYGEERTHLGQRYGVSLVRETVKASVRASDTLFNASMYQKLYTRAILWVKGLIERGPEGEDLIQIYRGFLSLEKDGGTGYAVPESRMQDILELYKTLVFTTAVNTGVPIDDLMPHAVGDQSAEAARRRAVPLTSMASELKEQNEHDEQDLVLLATALLRWRESGAPVDLDALSGEVETDIALTGTVNPVSDTERVQNTRSLYEAGFVSAEDVIAEWNPKKGEESRRELVERLEARGEKPTTEAGSRGEEQEGEEEKLTTKARRHEEKQEPEQALGGPGEKPDAKAQREDTRAGARGAQGVEEQPVAEVDPDALNGAQITAALDVLERLSLGVLSEIAAEELLAAVGIPVAKARVMVASMRGIKGSPQRHGGTEESTEGPD